MVGARFRRNKAKPRRRLLIRATGWRALAARVPLGLAAAGVGAVAPRASGVVVSRVRLTPWRRGAVGTGAFAARALGRFSAAPDGKIRASCVI